MEEETKTLSEEMQEAIDSFDNIKANNHKRNVLNSIYLQRAAQIIIEMDARIKALEEKNEI